MHSFLITLWLWPFPSTPFGGLARFVGNPAVRGRHSEAVRRWFSWIAMLLLAACLLPGDCGRTYTVGSSALNRQRESRSNLIRLKRLRLEARSYRLGVVPCPHPISNFAMSQRPLAAMSCWST